MEDLSAARLRCSTLPTRLTISSSTSVRHWKFSRTQSLSCRDLPRCPEVTPPTRIVWTNEEGDDDGAVTTVTFEEKDGQTLLVLRDLYPSKAALDEAIASGSTSGFAEQFEQLDALLLDMDAGA